MGKKDGEFDAWLERSLARELGSVRADAPSRDWSQPGAPERRRLAAASSAGGALALKTAAGLAVVVFAVGAGGTAATGTANPVAWGEAVEEAAISAVPVHTGPAGGSGLSAEHRQPSVHSPSPHSTAVPGDHAGEPDPGVTAARPPGHPAHPERKAKPSPPAHDGDEDASARSPGSPGVGSAARARSHD